MDKKLTTTVGIALGVSLLASAGYGIYKYFKGKGSTDGENSTTGTSNRSIGNRSIDGYLNNGLIKSKSVIDGGYDTGLTGGGLYKLPGGISYAGN